MKVKVGVEPEGDVARVRAVREAIGPDIRLGVDANGGWSFAQAIQTIPTRCGNSTSSSSSNRCRRPTCDVGDLDALQGAADATVARFGGIDVVVANAGIAPPSEPILTIDPGEFERTVDIDLPASGARSAPRCLR